MVVLCAEGDVWVKHIIWQLLNADGFTVLTAGDGETALEVSRDYPGSIDLLLSDVATPRLGGPELGRAIASERPGIKVLMMSNYLEERDRVSTAGLPFLQKPFTPTALRDSIEALLGPIPIREADDSETCLDGVRNDIEIQKAALIACRAKVVALLNILEGRAGTPVGVPMPAKKTARRFWSNHRWKRWSRSEEGTFCGRRAERARSHPANAAPDAP